MGGHVDIWNYQSYYLQPVKSTTHKIEGSHDEFMAAVSIIDRNLLMLQRNGDDIWTTMLSNGIFENWLLTASTSNITEIYRSLESRPSWYLINTRDGSRKRIISNSLVYGCKFSPTGRYVLWYDLEQKSYFTYDLKNDKTINISVKIPFPVYNELWDFAAPPIPYEGLMWGSNDECIYFPDRYDIWKVDLLTGNSPTNITSGYGRKNKIILRALFPHNDDKDRVINAADTSIYLCGFDEKTKDNGFFRLNLFHTAVPEKLTMGACYYYFPENFSAVSLQKFLLKARDANVYMFFKMSPTEFPNLIITKDFLNLKRVSNFQPQHKFNWLTAELIHWTTPDGINASGILYKPENFNPKRKYPVILNLYERQSDGLNIFIKPELSEGQLNIPLYVSQGYLVLCPDISYKVGTPGESIYNFVESATTSIIKSPWVDSQRIGVHGHSFGGFEVNYLITKTSRFAAAASSAGATNFVSACGALRLNMYDSHEYVALSQYRLGNSLWDDSTSYIRNSPVFSAKNVVCPLLMMHNKNDLTVPWSQAIEFFSALRYLNKKVWMLQYDNSSHLLNGHSDQLDYTTKLFQFFNHYLMNSPIPTWMKLNASRNSNE